MWIGTATTVPATNDARIPSLYLTPDSKGLGAYLASSRAMNGGPCFECMEVYAVSFRNCLEATGAGEHSVAEELGISASELHRRCEGGGVTRDAWAALGRWAEQRKVMFARRECITCFRMQYVIPSVIFRAGQ